MGTRMAVMTTEDNWVWQNIADGTTHSPLAAIKAPEGKFVTIEKLKMCCSKLKHLSQLIVAVM